MGERCEIASVADSVKPTIRKLLACTRISAAVRSVIAAS